MNSGSHAPMFDDISLMMISEPFFDEASLIAQPTSRSGDTIAMSMSPQGSSCSSARTTFSDDTHNKKPFKRRSRASSKKAQAATTTRLSTSPNNFRALVQKFTGHNSGFTPMRGPINLNFAKYKNNRFPNHQDSKKPASADRNKKLVEERSDDQSSFFFSSAAATATTSSSNQAYGVSGTVLANPKSDDPLRSSVDGFLEHIHVENFPVSEFVGPDDHVGDQGCQDLIIGDDFWDDDFNLSYTHRA